MPDLAEGLAIADENGQPLIDSTKPWGLIVQATGENEFRQIGFVPVKNFTGLMKMLTAMLGEDALKAPDDPENGTWKMEVAPADVTLFVKKQGGWAFVTNSEDLLAQLPADPTRMLDGLDKKYDFAARATIKNIPKELRDAGLGMLGMFGGMADDPNVNAAIKQAVDQATTAADQLDALLLGLTIDGEGGSVTIDVTTTVLPGTTLAEQFALAASATTNFAGFDVPDAHGDR